MRDLRDLRDAALLSELDVQVARGLARIVGETREDAVLAAAFVSRATRAGHVCFDLARAADFVSSEDGAAPAPLPAFDAWRDLLATSALVGEGEGASRRDTPLVLEGSRLYLRRYWDYERRLADALARRVAHVEADVDGALLRRGLDRLFGSPEPHAPDRQRLAAHVCVMRRFCIISGGPGTGKTTTVTKILALLQEQSIARRGRKLDIVLVAPTGKAAQRLRESIEKARGALDVTDEIRALVPSDATTIHRRLGTIPGSATRFRHDAQNPLACDVLLVDEASMIDLPLMTKLVEALPPEAKLILLGDRHQLASVEAGAILGDLCGLADGVVQLERSFRYAETSGIRALALAVNAGDGDEAVRLLTSGDHDDIALLPGLGGGGTGMAKRTHALRERAVAGYRAFFAERDPLRAAAALNGYRVLCAHHRGPFGTLAMNPLLEAALRDARLLRAGSGSPWYDHRPVLVTENDYAVNLFNGDVGIALRGDEGMRVHFATADGVDRALAPSRLPRHDTVFAMTVHKAQGSEFEDVAFVLPDAASKVMTRELVYTALTRPKRGVVVFGAPDVIRAAVGRVALRASWLRERIQARER
jgi:exodeoxyribonuclease V alpha subunit